MHFRGRSVGIVWYSCSYLFSMFFEFFMRMGWMCLEKHDRSPRLQRSADGNSTISDHVTLQSMTKVHNAAFSPVCNVCVLPAPGAFPSPGQQAVDSCQRWPGPAQRALKAPHRLHSQSIRIYSVWRLKGSLRALQGNKM